MAVGDPTDPSGFDLGASIRSTLAVAPTLASAPGVAVAVAQGNLSTTQTEQVASFQRGQQLQQFMAGQDAAAQSKLFGSLSQSDQILLTQAGYKAPGKAKRSIFGTIIHDAAGAGNDVLHVAAAPLRFVQHLQRAGELDPAEYIYSPGWGSNITSDDGKGNLSTTKSAAIWHPTSFVRAWRATDHGARAFDSKQIAAVQDRYSPDVFNLARQQAEGDSIQDITGGNPATLQAAQQVAQDPSYKQALADVKAAQISPGRQFANAIGLKPGSDAYNLTSGGVDGLDDWYSDPTLVGGKLAKAGMAAKWGIRANDTTRVETLMQTPQAQRGWDYLLPRINTIKNSEDGVAKGQALADIQRHFPNAMGLIDPLIEDANNAGRDVTMASAANYLSGVNGMARMAMGLAAREVPTLPGRLSKLGEARIAASDGVHKAIDFVTDGRRFLPYDQYATPEEVAAGAVAEGEDAGAEAQAASSQAYGAAALSYRKSLSGRLRYMARRLTTRVPNTSHLEVTGAGGSAGANSLKLVRQTALTYLPTSRANEITAAFAGADLAGKRAIYKGMLQELGHASGMTMSQSGADYWARFMGDVDAAEARETYAAMGNDSGVYVRNTGSGTRSLGGTAGQITQKWSIPSFKEMQQNAARIGVADRVMGGLNNSWVDSFMGKWRTGVLFRVAFPLRVAMEDLFNQFYRGNGMGVLQSRIATSRIARSVEGDPESALARSIGKVADGASSALGLPSSGAAIPIRYTLAKMAHVLRVGTDVFTDPDYEKYIAKLYDGTAKDRLYQGIIEDHKQLAQGAGDAMPEDLAADTKWGQIGWKPNGTFETGTAQGMNGALRWAHNLQYGADDPVAMHVMMNPEKSFDELAPEMRELMKSGEYDDVRKGAEIANWTKDGRSVAAGEATEDEALTDWAADIYTNFHHLIRDDQGKLIKPVTKYIADNKTTPSAQWLNQRMRDAEGNYTSEAFLKGRPDSVTGPEFVPYTKSTAANLIQRGWENIVARPMNYLSRQPIAHYEYVQARKMLEPWEAELLAKGGSTRSLAALPTAADGSLYRGVSRADQWSVDAKGDLHLAPATNFDGKTNGVSFSHDPATAIDYASRAVGPARSRAQATVLRIDADALDPSTLTRESSEEVSHRGSGVVIPAGKWSEHVDHSARSAVTKWISSERSTAGQLSHEDLAKSVARDMAREDDGGEAQGVTKGLSSDLVAKLGPNPGATVRYAEAQARSRVPAFQDAFVNAVNRTANDGKSALDDLMADKSSPLGDLVDHVRPAPVSAEWAKNVENIVDTRAQMIAHDRAIKFIHNPALRSQFSVIARNLFPFRHAEESALQRWSTALLYSPEGLRRAQLTVEGLHHSGIVTKDSSGNDYVAFPGSAALVQLSAKLANLLPGVNIAELPIKANMGFELKFVSPFLSQFGGIGTGNDPAEKALNDIHPLIPPSGPILGTALGLVHQFLPESRVAQDASEAFISQEGQGKPIWEQFVPTAVSRIYGAFQNSNDANSQLASAMRNAAAYMEAAGLSPDASASPDQVDQYLNRLKSWSRNMLVMRAIMGFATPAAPTVDQFSPKADELFAAEGIHSLTDEFYKMTSQMPYQDALTEFIKLHPDDSPFTVAQSEAPSGAQMPATVQTLNWMDSHVGLLKKYPSVAPFLMPLTSGPFNYDAYKEQLAAGIRQKKTVSDFYGDLKIRTASDTYYAARTQVNTGEATMRAQGDSKGAERLAAGFSAWSQQFQSLNPLFAQYLSEGSTRQQNKLEAINQLKSMVSSGDVNNLVGSSEADGITEMLGVWNEWQATKQSLYGRSDNASTNLRKSTQAGADSYISQIAGTNPQLQGLYSTIFAPLLATS